MNIRTANSQDIDAWSTMRSALWPESRDNHMSEIQAYFADESIDIDMAYVLEVDGGIVGFLELNIRNFAEGSREASVPYVEAWYISPKHQGKGYGKQLMRQAERWATSQGYRELASDTEIDNVTSIEMHKHLGFKETERVVCFLKSLDSA